MPAYIGRSRRIKDALVQILHGITYDTGAGAEPAFAQVADNTHDEFTSYPAVRVLPNVLVSTTAAFAQKDHAVTFAVITSLPLNNPDDIESATYNHMYDLADLITDTLEAADYDDLLTDIDPQVSNVVMEVNQGRWYVAEGGTGSLLLCNIEVQVTYAKDVN